MTLMAFLERLRGVQRVGPTATAFCPAHDDQRRSLSVTAKDGKLLVKCFRGCSAPAIVGALGVTLGDLFVEPIEPARPPQIVATYDYKDEGDVLLYQVVRFDPKDFRPRRPDGAGGWRWNLQQTRHVVYRLPDLAEQTRAYFVEGEKDADRLWSLGLAATTTQGGAKAWTAHAESYAQQLREIGLAEVVILPDHDAPGEEYATAVARSLLAVGLRVKIVRLPDLPMKGDVSDWLDAGRTATDLDRLVTAAAWGSTDASPSVLGAVPLSVALEEWEAGIAAGPSPAVRTPYPGLDRFLTGGFAPGELIYLGAPPGVGKTALGLEMARRAASDGVPVLVVSREMVRLALTRRLLAQAARVPAASLKSGQIGDADWLLVRGILPKLRALPIWLTDVAVTLTDITTMVRGFTPPLGLVIVDYLQLVRAPAEIRERRLQVEAVSQGLKTLAVSHGLPVLCLSSLSRRPGEKSETRPTLDRLRESGELEFDADIVLFLHRAFRATETELIVAKNRDGRTGTIKLTFRPEFVAFDEASDRAEADA